MDELTHRMQLHQALLCMTEVSSVFGGDACLGLDRALARNR